jgi:HAD superfamily hydrolase (TIGR01509 family)
MRDFPEFSGPMATWPRVESLPCAREALDTLRSPGWLVVLATNAVDYDEAGIWEALRRGGLGDSVDRIYCSRSVGHRKLDPAFFDFVLQDLGLGRSEVVMVGDDFAVDIVGANAAGLRAVWLSPDSEQARRAGT